MIYADARPQIRSGDLLAWTHTGWRSWRDIKMQIVRLLTRSEYSHVGVAWVVGGRVFVLEAVQPLVRIYPLSKLGDFYHLPMNATWTQQIEEFALARVGEPYSQAECVRAFFGWSLRNGEWECAEYAMSVLAEAGLFLGLTATPSAVVNRAQRLGALMVFVKGDIR